MINKIIEYLENSSCGNRDVPKIQEMITYLGSLKKEQPVGYKARRERDMKDYIGSNNGANKNKPIDSPEMGKLSLTIIKSLGLYEPEYWEYLLLDKTSTGYNAIELNNFNYKNFTFVELRGYYAVPVSEVFDTFTEYEETIRLGFTRFIEGYSYGRE